MKPVLALTQGDPAGIGPEILLKISRQAGGAPWRPLLIAERCALEALRGALPEAPWERLHAVSADATRAEIDALPTERLAWLDPVGAAREVTPGVPRRADAEGALAALDAGVAAVRAGVADALVTAPINKASIAHELAPSFRGHTDYLAAGAGLERYGRDYLMTFLAPDLRVALLSTHLPLRGAIELVRREAIVEALVCLHRHAEAAGVGGRIAVAGLNPHAGEGGLLGTEDDAEIRPAVEEARRLGIDVHGPESPDVVFVRARRGVYDWVLALYHDQGLIAVKTVAFGTATHWTLGLPYLRTSVDHGTAYDLAGRGEADAGPLEAVIEGTLRLLAQRRDTMG